MGLVHSAGLANTTREGMPSPASCGMVAWYSSGSGVDQLVISSRLDTSEAVLFTFPGGVEPTAGVRLSSLTCSGILAVPSGPSAPSASTNSSHSPARSKLSCVT